MLLRHITLMPLRFTSHYALRHITPIIGYYADTAETLRLRH